MISDDAAWLHDPYGEARVRWWDGHRWTQWTDHSYRRLADEAEISRATEKGWLPDPKGLDRLRWWDGEQWSEWTDQDYPSVPRIPSPPLSTKDFEHAQATQRVGRHRFLRMGILLPLTALLSFLLGMAAGADRDSNLEQEIEELRSELEEAERQAEEAAAERDRLEGESPGDSRSELRREPPQREVVEAALSMTWSQMRAPDKDHICSGMQDQPEAVLDDFMDVFHDEFAPETDMRVDRSMLRDFFTERCLR